MSSVGLNVVEPTEFSELDREITLTIPCKVELDHVYYAIVRTVLGHMELFFKHELSGKRKGNFKIIVPYPPEKSTIVVHGYLLGKQVFEWSRSAHQV